MFSTRVCEEIYRFELPREIPDLLLRIEAFYRWREIRDVARDGRSLRFARGQNGFWNWNWDERAQEHEGLITVSDGPRPTVTCHYTCAVWLFDVRIPERQLQREVEQLEKFLLANAELR